MLLCYIIIIVSSQSVPLLPKHLPVGRYKTQVVVLPMLKQPKPLTNANLNLGLYQFRVSINFNILLRVWVVSVFVKQWPVTCVLQYLPPSCFIICASVSSSCAIPQPLGNSRSFSHACQPQIFDNLLNNKLCKIVANSQS